jgi:hypothetical protein
MLFRPVDSHGDMLPIVRKSQLLKGADAVAEAIKSRMRLHRGEWFEDPDAGSPVLDLLSKEKITEDHIGAITHQIVGYISETMGVKSVQASQPAYNKALRSMTLPCTVTPTKGEAFNMEVSTNQ